MQKDVGLERSHEKQRGGAWIADAQHAGGGGAPEVAGDDAQPAARRRVVALGVEWQNERRLRAVVHVDGEVLRDRGLREGDESLGDLAQDGARIGGGVDGLQRGDEIGNANLAAANGGDEEFVLGAGVAEDRGGRDAKLRGDVGEGGGLVALGHEDAARGVEDLLAGNPRWAAH